VPIHVYVSGDEADEEARSLLAWLRDDSDIRRNAALSLVPASPATGEMGGALEAIKLVADEGFQVANFVLALVSWRATRSKRPKVMIKQNGVEITLPEADPEAVRKIVGALGSDAE
jgi:membrane-associated two-gene conflict system component 1 (EACC1)